LAPEMLDVGRALMKVQVEPYIRENVLFSPYLPCEAQLAGAAALQFDESTQLIRASSPDRSGSYTIAFQPNPSDATLEQYDIRIRNSRQTHFRAIPEGVRELARTIVQNNKLGI